MGIEIRSITDSEFPAWNDAIQVGFYSPAGRDGGVSRRYRWEEELAAGLAVGGFDGEQVVGTLGMFTGDMTVPGGAKIPCGAITAVTVRPTHLRRGILTGMMAKSHEQSAALGAAASILIPAEYPIYGRFGYGQAAEEVELTIDATAAKLLRELPGTISLVSAEEWCELGSEFYERLRTSLPGSIDRREWWWRLEAGLIQTEGKDPDKSKLFAVLSDGEGVVRGYAVYTIKDGDAWSGFRPKVQMNASIVAETPQARVRLMQYLWEHDWVSEVRVGSTPIDATWRRLLVNPRVVTEAGRYDVLWVRPLDVPALLSQRTYEQEGRLVIGVQDKDGHAEGVYALEGGPDGATCTRTSESPDLTMPVQTLGSLYLGGYAASSQASIGLVAEERAGALTVADRMFKTTVPPFAQTWF
jgi:predicted acetyltransferase